MNVRLEILPETEAALTALAHTRGLTVEQWLTMLAEQHLQADRTSHLQKSNPAEWMRQFRAWAEGHDRTTPLLSEDAVGRESIYSDRL